MDIMVVPKSILTRLDINGGFTNKEEEKLASTLTGYLLGDIGGTSVPVDSSILAHYYLGKRDEVDINPEIKVVGNTTVISLSDIEIATLLSTHRAKKEFTKFLIRNRVANPSILATYTLNVTRVKFY